MNRQAPSQPAENGMFSSPSGSIVEQKNNSKLGIWLFLGGEVIFFSTLILTFVLFRLNAPAQYEQFKQNLNIPLIGINTFVLITSSYMVVRSLEAIQHNNQRWLIWNLIAVFVLGAVFLGGQAFEWSTLFSDGVGVSSIFGTPFFTITGIHGTHVFIGLIWASVLIYLASRGFFQARHHQAIELFGLYWHFVDIVWIVLFTLFYLI